MIDASSASGGSIVASDPALGVRLLTFDRPEKLNALSASLVLELEQELLKAAADNAVRVVLLTGAGTKAFIAGADIAEYRGGRADAFAEYQLTSRRVFDGLEAIRKPVIAAVNGYALGGGFEIALCCDVIVCSTNAQFGLPEGKLGLVPGGGGTQRLLRLVGRQTTAELLLAARFMPASRAHQLGIVAACVEPDQLVPTALSLAAEMLRVGPEAQAEAKWLLREGAEFDLPTALSLEQDALLRRFASAEGQEGIEAFLDKRQPAFNGAPALTEHRDRPLSK